MALVLHEQDELVLIASLDGAGALELACRGQSLTDEDHAVEVILERGLALTVRVADFEADHTRWLISASHLRDGDVVIWPRSSVGGCSTILHDEGWYDIEVVATDDDDPRRAVITRLRLCLRRARPRRSDVTRGPRDKSRQDEPGGDEQTRPSTPGHGQLPSSGPPQSHPGKPVPANGGEAEATEETEVVEEAEPMATDDDDDTHDLRGELGLPAFEVGNELPKAKPATHASPPKPVPEPAPVASPIVVPQPELATVQLGASAPAKVRVGEEFTARFVAYGSVHEVTVEAMLSKLSPRAEHHLGVARTRWPIGVEVEVELQARGLEIDEPVQRFVWSGDWEIVDFDVYVPEDARPRTIVLKFDASVQGMPTGRVRVDLELVPADATTDANQRSEGRAESFRSAFASYATEDRQRVIDHVMAMRTLTGIDVFLDCASLRAGDDFEQRIIQEIRDRQLYLLFWSRAAGRSTWVNREWRLAHRVKEPEDFKIQPLEPHDQAPPPPELRHLNFNDPLLMIRTADALARQSRGGDPAPA